MKTNDILLYGGLAFVAYMILKPPTAAAQTIVPVTTAPAGTGLLGNNPVTGSLLSNLANALKNITVPAAKAPTSTGVPAPAPYAAPPEVQALTPAVIDSGYVAAYGDAGNITDPSDLGSFSLDAGSGSDIDDTMSGVYENLR
jgi:hypothetical protein